MEKGRRNLNVHEMGGTERRKVIHKKRKYQKVLIHLLTLNILSCK